MANGTTSLDQKLKNAVDIFIYLRGLIRICHGAPGVSCSPGMTPISANQITAPTFPSDMPVFLDALVT